MTKIIPKTFTISASYFLKRHKLNLHSHRYVAPYLMESRTKLDCFHPYIFIPRTTVPTVFNHSLQRVYINRWPSLDRSCAGNIFFIEAGLLTMSGLYRCHISGRTIAKTWRPPDLNSPLPPPHTSRLAGHPDTLPPCISKALVDLHLFLYTAFNKALGLILKILP